ncbi:MAG TPA: type II toxin-antitoxin system PemK/MazF family toxin [Candidatus Dormibacteraeota bacterium]|nr:type II toxin-antitoxin system PemK/MazF family toxin [Candidatus Dormibacteraeota bacterium]
MIRRGTIYWAQLDPTIGSEIKKTRPALIISNDQNNQASSLVTVVPITSNTKLFGPFEVYLETGEGGLKKPGKLKANQVRTIDKQRLADGPLGPTLSDTLMQQVNQALKIHLAID